MKNLLPVITILAILLTMSNCDTENMSKESEPERFKLVYFSEGHTSGEVPVDTNTYTANDSIQLLPPNTLYMSPITLENDKELLKEIGLFLGSLEKEGYDKNYITGFTWNVDGININPMQLININKNTVAYAVWD